jgi:multifunctional beta-oxidation protein
MLILGVIKGAESASNGYLDAIKKAIGEEGVPTEYKFEDRDSILYNLGIGAKRTELNYVL